MYYFCTYFDKHYLDKGMALYHSLMRHCQPFRLWTLCMDDETYRTLTEKKLPGVTTISLSMFEWEDPGLAKAKSNRSQIEYYFTCTPTLITGILERNPYIDVLTYLDADLYFFNSIQPVYAELGDKSVLIVGHRFPESLKHLEKYGIYNVGLLSFRNDQNGKEVVEWWRRRCLEWCYDRVEDGKFADQGYLNDWPTRFPGVVVSQNRGVGLAPWNLASYDGQPIIEYHFHDLKQIDRATWDTNVGVYGTPLSDTVKQMIYIPYIKELNLVSTFRNDDRLTRGSGDSLKKKIYDTVRRLGGNDFIRVA